MYKLKPKITLSIIALIMLVGVFSFSSHIFAAQSAEDLLGEVGTGIYDSYIPDKSLPEQIGTVIKLLLGTLGLLAVVIIIYGGAKWMFSGGESGKVDAARKLIINAVIGLVIILTSYSVTLYVLGVLQQGTGI